MFRTKFGSLAISFSLLTLPVIPSFIAAADEIEEVVAVGSRRDARSVGDSPAPVDVIWFRYKKPGWSGHGLYD